MDRFAANTLRTLGIIATAIVVILGSLILLLLALCFGALSQNNPNTGAVAAGCLLAACGLVAGGIFVIGRLAKQINREPNPLDPPYDVIPRDTVSTPFDLPKVVDLDAEPAPPPAPPIATTPPPQPAAAHTPPPPTPQLARPTPRALDLAHLSPASRSAIEALVLAIIAKLAAEAGIMFYGWVSSTKPGVAAVRMVPFAFLVWGIASILPYLVLIYLLLRQLGQRAFAYALVIPAVHVLVGFFSYSTSVFFVLRMRSASPAPVLLSFLPWILDIVILYYAWKAIRQTGIHPEPVRLVVASAVILIYSALARPLFLFLTYTIGQGRR